MDMIIEKANTQYSACRIPGLVLTKCGTLLGYYECRSSSSDWAQIDLKVIRSKDEGKSWETVQIIPGRGETLNNPMMIVDGGTIHFLYCRNYKDLFYCRSEDDGVSFSEPVEISYVFENSGFDYTVAAIGPGHGIVHNGNLLLPVWFACDHNDPHAHHPSFISTIYSPDHGRTWKCGELIGKDDLMDPSECALAVTSDGKIINSIRNENPPHQRAVATSPDGFSHWSNPEFMDILPDPICMGSMTHMGGTIFHINCHNSERSRIDLTVKITTDNFRTVTCIPVDDVGGYSDIAVTDDKIFVLYERDPSRDGLYFKTISY